MASVEAGWREIRTDLAHEANEVATERAGGSIPGVRSQTEEKGSTKVVRVVIETPEAGRILGKMPGYYVTIESKALRERDRDELEEVAKIVAEEIQGFIRGFNLGDEAVALVIGLGNWNATPDALGPRVIEKVLVTRHLYQSSPPEKRGGLRPVCAFSPGVLGITGVETSELVAGVVQKIRPGFIIVIDALASRVADRMGAAVQLADSGIQPGSGVGNRRVGITSQSLGVPVIALGVPTVVEATTIVNDALDQLGRAGRVAIQPGMKREIISRVLDPFLQRLIVTPKEIDILIQDLAKVVAGAINIALHPGVAPEEVFRYLD